MKIFVYNYADDEKVFWDKFAAEYNVELGCNKGYPSLDNIESIKGYEGVSIYVTDMNAAILQKMYDMGVRYITTRSVGFNHFDMDKVKELGLRVSVTPYSPNSVANYAIMLMLMCCRKVKQIMEGYRIQDFSLAGKRGVELSVSTVGVVGTGKIGRTLIEHLSGFGCKILAYDIFESDEVRKYAEYVELDTLFSESDIVTFHAPAAKENTHMINRKSLQKMKDGVILINTARGDLVDTEALIEGIESGKIGAAGLDVIEEEYGLYYHNLANKVINNRNLAVLRSFPNVIVLPHTAFYTDQAISDMIENGIRGCCLFAEGKENPFEVK